MIRGFTFERALSWPFTAPHAGSFPWIFGLAYALSMLALLAVVGFFSFGNISEWIQTVEALEGSPDPEVGMAVVGNFFWRMLPWALIGTVLFWALWAMFETASQRRYIWGQGFSLGFGADEMRMMVVGLLYGLMGFVLIGVPVLLVMGSTFWTLFSEIDNPGVLNSTEFEERVVLQVFGMFGLMLVLFPVYVFFATRLAPCFGLTVMSKRIRFLDAWAVSRGRFWPILGAYVILAVAGGVLGQIVSGIGQAIMMPVMLDAMEGGTFENDPASLFTSPQMLLAFGAFYFIALFVQGVMQHIVGGPAAYAARHDPAGGVEEAGRVDVFG